MLTELSPSQLAENAIRVVLKTQWDRVPALRIDSPPGAGKTSVVEMLAAQAFGIHRERCAIATQTNEQAFDLGYRLARSFPGLEFWLFVRRDLILPERINSLGNLLVARAEKDIPLGPSVVVSNAHKWSYLRQRHEFDLLIVDEAFQLPDFRFHEIASLGQRLVLIGDPGQIAPIIRCEIERWKSDPAGPHIPAPAALLHRHPDTPVLRLPVSRRLVQDSVRFVQPAFYPTLAFQAMSTKNQRRLLVEPGTGNTVDMSIDSVAGGASIVNLELPGAITGQSDPEAAELIISIIDRLLKRRALILDDGTERLLDPSQIGVVCSHVSQVNSIVQRLPPAWSGVLVETADRYQGLERSIMIVHHPLSGRSEANQFHMDVGRLCVMLSRHRVCCFVISRKGIDEVLLRYNPNGERVLGVPTDREHLGWQAHVHVMRELRLQERVLAVNSTF